MFMSGYEVDKCMTVNYVVVGLSAEQKIKKIINGIEIINCTWWIYISTSQFTQYPHRQSWRICLLFVCSFSNLYFFITPFRYIYMPRSNIIPTVNYFKIYYNFQFSDSFTFYGRVCISGYIFILIIVIIFCWNSSC